MGDVNLEIKLSNLDERVIKIEESGGGSGGDGYITSVSNDFNVVNKKLSLSNDITTKLSKVDDKIDKPASATDGQVLTYNGTSNEWEAKNPSASITEPTDLEKGIIGGDEWVAQSYTKGATVIYNNKIYYCKADCSASNLPSEPDSNYWEETSLGVLNSKFLKNNLLSEQVHIPSGLNVQHNISFTERIVNKALILVYGTNINKLGTDIRMDSTILYIEDSGGNKSSYFTAYERRSNSVLNLYIQNNKVQYFSGTLNPADEIVLIGLYYV